MEWKWHDAIREIHRKIEFRFTHQKSDWEWAVKIVGKDIHFDEMLMVLGWTKLSIKKKIVFRKFDIRSRQFFTHVRTKILQFQFFV